MVTALRTAAEKLLRRAEVEEQTLADARERHAQAMERKRARDAELDRIASTEKDGAKRAHKLAQARAEHRRGEVEAGEEHVQQLQRAIAAHQAELDRRAQDALKQGTPIDQAAGRAALQATGVPPVGLTTWMGSDEGRAFAERGKRLKADLGAAERALHVQRGRLRDAKRLASQPLSVEAVDGLMVLANTMAGLDELTELTGQGVDLRNIKGTLELLEQHGIKPKPRR